MADIVWASNNNRATVRALLVDRLQNGNQPDRNVHPYYQPWSAPTAPPPQPSTSTKTSSASPPPACPMHNAGQDGTAASPKPSLLNPLNNIPTLSQERAAKQKTNLSIDRVVSTIPRSRNAPAPGASPYDEAVPSNESACPVPHDQRGVASGPDAAAAASSSSSQEGNWEYPSAQQFYNALVRKGWETPEEHVEMMVMVHNFLNERAWLEVLDWERDMGVDPKQISLARFQGKPGTISPKARLFSWAALVAPSKFSSEAPFDRHDWIVRRPASDGGKEVRYVIDYYSAPDDPDTDEPVFHLDVRPALDSFQAAQARLRRTWSKWRTEEGKDGAKT